MARQMYFGSKEEAVAFVERQGIPYEVAPHHVASKARPKKFQGYGDNYSYKKKGLPVGGLRSEQLAAAKK
jgi:NADH dehydrogenase (ubiquinone) Fe-S protein 4